MLGSCGVLRAPLRTFHFVVATFPCRVGRGEGVGFPERVWPFLLSALFHGVSPEFRVLEFVCSPEGGNGFYLRVCESIWFSVSQFPDYLSRPLLGKRGKQLVFYPLCVKDFLPMNSQTLK